MADRARSGCLAADRKRRERDELIDGHRPVEARANTVVASISR